MTSKETPSLALGFNDLGLPDTILDAVQALGFSNATPIQQQAIPALLSGRDVLGQAQTGTGKTAAFALPLLANIQVKRREPQILVLTPTRELALQVAEAFASFAANIPGLNILPIYGGQGYSTQLSMLRKGAHIIIGTPGRVMDHMRRGTLNLDSLKTLILDEADEMLRMGFAEDVEWILEQSPKQRQIGLFSATMPAAIKEIAENHLDNPIKITIKSSAATTPSIQQFFWQVSNLNKLDALCRIIESADTDAVIVFVRTKRATEEVAESLVSRGFNAVAINGDIVQQQRERVIDQLKTGRIKILIATDVAARGIDVDRVTHVINYDAPNNAESYVHRIGRTGRAGRAGTAIIFISPKDRYILRDIERTTKQEIKPLETPSVKSINERRIAAFKQKITAALEQDTSFFETMLGEFIQENGVEALKVAAALAKMGHGNKEFLLKRSETAPISNERPSREPREYKDRERSSRERPRYFESRASEPRSRSRSDSSVDFRDKYRDKFPQSGAARRSGAFDAPSRSKFSRDRDADMEQYRVEIGANDGLLPKNLVGAIANTAGIEGRLIGKIKIQPKFSLVDLPKGMPKDILRTLQKLKLSGKQMNLQKV